jgi:hypothetical protein
MKNSHSYRLEFGPCMKAQNTEDFWLEALGSYDCVDPYGGSCKSSFLQTCCSIGIHCMRLSLNTATTEGCLSLAQVCAVRMAFALQTRRRNAAIQMAYCSSSC